MDGTRLSLTEEVGVPRKDEVVRCGVPLAAGVLRDAERHVVLVGGTTPVAAPVASQVLRSERDRDGWVRWVALAFPVSVEALGTVAVFVGAGDRPAPRVMAAVTHGPGGRLVLSTGEVEADVFLDPFAITAPALTLSSSRVVLVDPDGVRHVAVVAREGVAVVHEGPLVAEVALSGRYEAEGENADAAWVFRARVTAVAGAPHLDVEVGVVNDAAAPESGMGEWAVELHTPPVATGTCGVFDAAHRSEPPFVVSHRGEGHPRGVFATSQVVGGADWTHAGDADHQDRWEWSELHGRQAANWVAARSAGTDGEALTVAAHRFAENHPADLAVLPSGVTVRLWPADAGPLLLTQGAAKSRLVRVARGGSTRTGTVLDSPLVGHPLDAAATGAVPRYLPYLPERYPNLEAHIREELSGWYQSGQSLGFHDFGDSVQGIERGPRTGYSANNEHDALLALALHFLRSGERAYHDSAQAYADHLCDLDLVHHSTVWPGEVGGLRAHGRSHVHYVEARTPEGPVRTSVDTGHLWTEGLVLFGQVTGEQRYLDAARKVADCLVGLTEIGWTRPEPGPRNSGWPLMALTAVAAATGDQRYLDAARATAKSAVAAQAPDGRWLMRLGLVDDYCAWQNAVLLTGLARLVALEESAEVRASFLAGCQALLDLGRNRDGTFVYLNRFDYRWANRSALVREALGLAFDATSDERYLQAGLAGGARWYRPRGSAPALSNDVAEWRGHLPFLVRAHEAGLLDDLPDAG